MLFKTWVMRLNRDEAITVAKDWLQIRDHLFGSLRYARYVWEYSSELGVACDYLVSKFVYIPSPFGLTINLPQSFRWEQGWLVVFNPHGREAENSDQCVLVWIDEVRGTVQGKV